MIGPVNKINCFKNRYTKCAMMRMRLNLTQQQLGELTGLTNQQISIAERYGNTTNTIHAANDVLAAFYKMDTEDLFPPCTETHRRRLGLRDEVEKASDSMCATSLTESPDVALENKEKIFEVLTAISTVKLKQAEIYLRVVVGGETLEDVAKEVKLSKARIGQIMDKLKKIIVKKVERD